VQDQAGRGADGDRERVRDGVVDREELQVERTVRAVLPFGDLGELRGETVFLALGGEQGEGEPGADDRHVGPHPQQERDRADVVLVAVREHQRVHLVEAVLDGAEVGQDQVDAGLVVLGEQHAAVDDQQPAVVLEHGHVPTDLADPTERDHPQTTIGQDGRRIGGAGRRAGCRGRRGRMGH